LVARAEAGEEIVLARGKVPIAKIVPHHPVTPKRQFGAFQGKGWVGPEFLIRYRRRTRGLGAVDFASPAGHACFPLVDRR
jgi:antitoxin (DNA-binding transcriptional repressor) of toxin-antitoxin stability system